MVVLLLEGANKIWHNHSDSHDVVICLGLASIRKSVKKTVIIMAQMGNFKKWCKERKTSLKPVELRST